MTGRQRIESAFSEDGTPEIPAVICYEGIYIRDHWDQLTALPWWYREVPHLDHQIMWRRKAIGQIGQDWFYLPSFYSREEQQHLFIEVRPEGVFRVDKRVGTEEKLMPPQIGGWPASGERHPWSPDYIAGTPDEIDRLVPLPSMPDPHSSGVNDGRMDLAAAMLREFGEAQYPVRMVSSPLWSCYDLWGFEDMMAMIATRPDLVEHACRRFLALGIHHVRQSAALGAAGIWIEDCLTDMIHPDAFAALNVPFLARLVEEIHALGLNSIYYFCGNPAGKWGQIIGIGVDALALEESKKGFVIDIEEVVAQVRGRCTVLGNLDAIGVLQNGTEEHLRAEIARQVAAGRRNGNRFIMSLGSPVTPETSVAKVRLYCDLAHEIGAS